MVRYHAELRQHLFSPLSAGNLPVQAQRLLPKRRTEIILEDGEQEVVEDDWNDPKVSQKNVSAEFGGQKWFGRAIFELKPEGSVRRWEAEDAENREAADSEGNMEAEESEEFKRSRAAAEPTRRQREEHLEQNHAVYKPWCEICVQSRGLGTQHRRRKRKQAAEDAEGPRIFSDFFFMSTEEDSVPMLALKFSRSKRIAATALPHKGVSDLGCKFFANFVKMTGVNRFINFSDGENALKALKQEAVKRIPEVEAIPKECPVGDHQKNGDIESGVRELKRQMRAIRMNLENRLGKELSEDDPLLTWIPTFAGDCIAFHRRGDDGKTPWERETGAKWRRPCLEFGEKVMMKEAYERTSGPKRDWRPRMIPVRYVGRHARTGAVMGLTPNGVKFGTGVTRLSESERWSTEGLNELRGVPWELNPRVREVRAVGVGDSVAIPRLPLASGGPVPRSFYVKREDVKPDKYGFTQGCVSCENIMRTGRSGVAHTSECRDRIFRLMEKDESERVKLFQERRQKLEESEGAAAVAVAEEDSAEVATAKAEGRDEKGEGAEDEAGEGRKREASGAGSREESPTKRLTPSSHWQKEGHSVYKKKREAQVPTEELQKAEDEVRAKEAPQSSTQTVEDVVVADVPAVEQVVSAADGDISNFEVGEEKGVFVEMAARVVRECFARKDVKITDKEVMQIAAFQVQMAGSHVAEEVSLQSLACAATTFGLQPGLVFDLNEFQRGGGRDLRKKELGEVEELEKFLDKEEPMLLVGSPACELNTQMLGLSNQKSCPEEEEKVQRGRKYLHEAIRLYRKQRDCGRFFVHDHPAGAFSWTNEELIALQQLPGVFTVTGPNFDWRLGQSNQRGKGLARKPAVFVTNSKHLAEAIKTCSQERKSFYRDLSLQTGLAVPTAAYPPGIVTSMLAALKRQMMEDGTLSELDIKYGGPVPSQPLFNPDEDCLQEDYEKFWDNISGEELPKELVQKARQEEVEWIRSIQLYDKVPRAEALQKNITPLKIRWVDVNKGDRASYNVRSRLVGKELKAKTKGSLLAHELFSAMPPWEMVKSLLSLLVTDGFSSESQVLGVFDISRAHFMAPASRELYVEIPEEDREEGEGDTVGRLNRSMYGFRDASHNWMEDWQALLKEEGYEIGVANPALFWNPKLSSRGAVHGDDFYVLGTQSAIDRMAGALKSKYSVRESHRLGFQPNCTQNATILNRVVSLGEQGGRRFVQIEPDQRHVEIIVSSLGLHKSNTKGVKTPSLKSADGDVEKLQHDSPLSPVDTSLYRSCVMRASFLSQDRADLGECVKSLAQGMANPKQWHFQALKRLGRYLLYKPVVALRYWQQKHTGRIVCMVDSDHASDRMSRKSTTGMVVRLNDHVIKTSSNLQTSIGLNVSEAEYYALVHGAAHGLGLRSYFADLGLPMDIVVQSDSNAAKAFASRRGLGKQRHVMTRYLWLQERVKCNHISLQKISTDDNFSDILTKSVSAAVMQKHMESMSFTEVEASKFHKSVLV